MPVLEALGTAVPGPAVLQSDVRKLAEQVLSNVAPELLDKLDVFDSTGIRKRHFVRPLEWFLEPHGWEDRAKVHREVGLALLEEAALQALDRAGLRARDVDGVVLVSTTGVSTPSLDARLVNRIGLRPDVARVPVFGLGCAGGVAGLDTVGTLARGAPGKRWLLLSMETCSANFDLTDMTPRGFVAATLFADGCAAALVRGDDAGPGPAALARLGRGAWHQWPDSEDVMGWDVRDEGLRVVFSRRIPDIVAKELAPVVERFAPLRSRSPSPYRHVFHPGGTKVLQAYESALGLAPSQLDTARTALAEFGNMSSPTVLFALEDELARRPLAQGETALLAALGPGFTAALATLEG